MKPRTRAVLARLEQGPASTHDLGEMFGYRYGARLCELRAAGYVIETVRLRQGSHRYTLISEPEVGREDRKVPVEDAFAELRDPDTTARPAPVLSPSPLFPTAPYQQAA